MPTGNNRSISRRINWSRARQQITHAARKAKRKKAAVNDLFNHDLSLFLEKPPVVFLSGYREDAHPLL
jgi:hypothetical protein